MIKIIAVVLLVLLVFSGFMYLKQPDMVFYPYKDLRDAPGSMGMDYEDVTIKTSDEGVELHAWYIPRQGASKTLLFFHGNAGNISWRIESIKIFHDAGMNVFIVDYRGYGKSTGTPSEKGLYKDAHSAWQYLTQTRRIPAKDIVIFGRSLGGVVATQLASEVSAAGLIVESAFSSAKDVARTLMPTLSYLIYLRYSFDAAQTISKVGMPKLILHSPGDDIIPFKLGKKLYDSAGDPKIFYELRGDHNSGFMESQPEYQETLEKFIASLDVQ